MRDTVESAHGDGKKQGLLGYSLMLKVKCVVCSTTHLGIQKIYSPLLCVFNHLLLFSQSLVCKKYTVVVYYKGLD